MISFGLVQVAVSLVSATEDKDLKFHQIHKDDGGRIRMRKTCELDGQEVRTEDIARGYPLSKDEIVVLTDEDLADLPLASTRAMEVLEFVPEDQVDPIMYEKAYYIVPDKIARKPYALLRDAIAASGRVAICKATLGNRERLATIRVSGKMLVLETMRWPDEVRPFELDLSGGEVPHAKEVAMARSLVENMTKDWDPKDPKFHDDYRAALREVVDAKVEGRDVVKPAVSETHAKQVTDLMDALRASVARSKGEEPAAAKKPAPKAPPKKAAAKAAPAKRVRKSA